MSINFARYGCPPLEIPKMIPESPLSPMTPALQSPLLYSERTLEYEARNGAESDVSFEPDPSESSESFESCESPPVVVPEALTVVPPVGVKPTPSLQRAQRVFARVIYYALIAGVWTPLMQWSPILYATIVATHCSLKIV